MATFAGAVAGLDLGKVQVLFSIGASLTAMVVGVFATANYIHTIKWKQQQHKTRKEGKAEVLTPEEAAMLEGYRRAKHRKN